MIGSHYIEKYRPNVFFSLDTQPLQTPAIIEYAYEKPMDILDSTTPQAQMEAPIALGFPIIKLMLFNKNVQPTCCIDEHQQWSLI